MNQLLIEEECKKFYGRKNEICTGKSDISLRDINLYRERWGLLPLSSKKNKERIKSDTSHINVNNRKKCTTCSGKKIKPVPIFKTGVGEELRTILKKYNVPYCQSCSNLANVMNEYGPEKCLSNIDDIINDILPRAREWVSKEYPWASAMFPNCVKDIEIKRRIKSMILEAIDTFKRKQQLKQDIFKPLKNGKILCSKQDVINECTVIVKSFKRFDYLIRFIESVFKYYTDLDIIIADDSLKDGEEYPEKIIEIMSHPLITWIKLPFDSGLSVGRNECVKLVNKKYTILCDDDYIVDEYSNFEKMLSVIKSNEKISLIGGLVEENKRIINWSGKYSIRNNILYVDKLGEKFRVAGGVEYKYTDSTLNYFIAETESLRRVPWTNEIKISGEHIDFFIRRFKAGEISAYTPEAKIKHDKKKDKDYNKYRLRISEFQDIMKKNNNLKEVRVLTFQNEEFK
jgi:GT2 family glycosyltransferase